MQEIFSPAASTVPGEDADPVGEADVEHASARELIARIQSISSDEDLKSPKPGGAPRRARIR